jgi:hypothetical protein
MAFRRPGDDPLKEMAQLFQVGADSSVSVAARRLKERMRVDRVLQSEVDAIKHQLFER